MTMSRVLVPHEISSDMLSVKQDLSLNNTLL